MSNEQIANIFSYHAPVADQPERYASLRSKALELALLIQKLCPESREKRRLRLCSRRRCGRQLSALSSINPPLLSKMTHAIRS